MDLFFTRLDGWSMPAQTEGTEPTVVTTENAGELGLIDGLPFVLRDDGRPDEHLNAFLRHLAVTRRRAANTWVAYARDVLAYCRFLRQKYGIEWHQAEVAHLEAYKTVRVTQPQPGVALSPSSWNRHLAALDALYRWAVRRTTLVARSPIERTELAAGAGPPNPSPSASPHARTRRSGDGTRKELDEPAPHDTIRYVTRADYRYFRRVGLRGLPPDGEPDPEWRGGANGARNASYADLLVSTGLRGGEGSNLVVWELPPLHRLHLTPDACNVEFELPAVLCKGRKSRRVLIPIGAYRQVRAYVDVERGLAVQDAHATGGLPAAVRRPVHVRHLRGLTYAPLNGDVHARHTCDKTGIEERRRLLVCLDGAPVEPASLWLKGSGGPLRTRSWQDVFRAANDRCALSGRPLHVKPHDLRHTFAINYLSALIGKQIDLESARDLIRRDAPQARHLFGDALQEVRRRMGHVHISTTWKYLEYLAPLEAVVDAATRALDGYLHEDDA